MSFAEEIARADHADAAALIASATESDARRALGARRITAHDLAALLSPAAEGLLGQIATRAGEETLRHFGRTVQLYAPLYLSNECDNGCVYCGFSARNRVARMTLSDDEVMREAQALRDRGFRHVLLLTGEAPRAVGAERLAGIARRLRKLFSSISIEVFPMDEASYESMASAGVDGLTVYQETYDRETYSAVHPAGPKRDYDFRLGAAERGAAAGMRRVGIGSLLGLSDFRRDVFFTALHGAYLTRRFWRTHVMISFPRLRGAEGGYSAGSPVSDRQLALAIGAVRLFLPRAGIVLSTREGPRLRDALLPFGVTQMSAGSCTQPGGYTGVDAAEAQFEVSDERTPEEVCAAIRAAGYDPVWKDWDAAYSEVVS